jgi:fatty acid desaturase
VFLILVLSAVDLGVYLLLDSPWLLVGYWLLGVVPKGIVSCWSHHHQHVLTFRSAALNRVYELCLALHTGMTTNLWVLHHVLGHHVNYRDQTVDESRWKRLDGERMGVVEYTLNVAGTAYYRAYQVGKRCPRHQRLFLLWAAITLVVVAGLVWQRPLQALFVYVVPMVTTLLYTSWVTYDHHAGLQTDDPFEASYNADNYWFNLFTGNLGYHTAHHHRQAVHWSMLPELHGEIANRIPKHLSRKTLFGI